MTYFDVFGHLFAGAVFFIVAQATAPQNVRGTVLQYSSEQLLVHLDDQDGDMQRAVFEVLEVRHLFLFRLFACTILIEMLEYN